MSVDLSLVPDGASTHLTVRWRTRRDAWFAPAGHEVAWDQVTGPDAITCYLAIENKKDGSVREATFIYTRVK